MKALKVLSLFFNISQEYIQSKRVISGTQSHLPTRCGDGIWVVFDYQYQEGGNTAVRTETGNYSEK